MPGKGHSFRELSETLTMGKEIKEFYDRSAEFFKSEFFRIKQPDIKKVALEWAQMFFAKSSEIDLANKMIEGLMGQLKNLNKIWVKPPNEKGDES